MKAAVAEATASKHRQIDPDLRELLSLHEKAASVAAMIQGVVDPTYAPFLRQRKIFGKLFPTPEVTKYYGYDKTTGSFRVFENRSESITQEGKFTSVHEVLNPGGTRTPLAAWEEYRKLFSVAGIGEIDSKQGLDDPVLRAFGTLKLSDDDRAIAISALYMLKLIYHRAENEPRVVYDPQIIYVLRIATLQSDFPIEVTVDKESANFNINDGVPDIREWLSICSTLKRPGPSKKDFFADKNEDCLEFTGKRTVTDAILSALYQVCRGLQDGKPEHVRLTKVQVNIDATGLKVQLHCSDVFPRNEISKDKLKESKDRSFRSAVKDLCDAVSSEDPTGAAPENPDESCFSLKDDDKVFYLFLKRSVTHE